MKNQSEFENSKAKGDNQKTNQSLTSQVKETNRPLLMENESPRLQKPL